MKGRERIALLEGENRVFELRAHGYTLAWPAFLLVFTVGVGAFLAGTVPDSDARTTLRLIIAATAGAIVLRWSVWPFLSWYGHSYVLTDRRLIVREGVLARRGIDVPLVRVIGSSATRTVLQRMFRCGRLTISTAGQYGDVVLEDAPMVAEVQRVIAGTVSAAMPAVPSPSLAPQQPFPPQQFPTGS